MIEDIIVLDDAPAVRLCELDTSDDEDWGDEDQTTLGGVIARFWHKMGCWPGQPCPRATPQRLTFLYFFTYSYGNDLWIKQNHARDVRAEWQALRHLERFRLPATCWACDDAAAAHWHHIVPIARGGDNQRVNLVPLCRACHRTAHHLERDARA